MGHWDWQATEMVGPLGWVGHQDNRTTGIGKPHGWAGYREGRPPGNGKKRKKWPGLICQFHEQRRAPQLV